MRYVLIIGDGIADRPLACLSNKTPLESLSLPGMARLSSQCLGLVRTVPEGCPPGSDTAILSIMGSDPRTCFTGRAALEAVGAGVPLKEGETAWRVNLVTLYGDCFEDAVIRSHNGQNIEGEDALALVRRLLGDPGFAALSKELQFVLHESPTFRQIGVMKTEDAGCAVPPPPHDHLGEMASPLLVADGAIRALMEASFRALRGRQANCIWPWAPGKAMTLQSFAGRYGHAGPVISAVPLVKGIALLSGLPAPFVAGATGALDTNYEGKVEAALEGLRQGADFAAIHIEAPDECSHAMDVPAKLEALRRLDARVILPLLNALDVQGDPYRVLFLSDHPTFSANGAHDGAPVPFALYDSRKSGAPRAFHEANAAVGGVVPDGTLLMPMLFGEDYV